MKKILILVLIIGSNLINSKEAKLVCIKKGLIGMPNISAPNYLGKFIDKNGDTCYVFEKE